MSYISPRTSQVAKWGNSLAVRIPVDVAAALGLKEGDSVTLCGLEDDKIGLVAERRQREQALVDLEALGGTFPAGFKFVRGEDDER